MLNRSHKSNQWSSLVFFHLRQLTKVKPFLSLHNFEILIHAFLTTHLDYCCTLYSWRSQMLLSGLQLVQNAAAHLLTGTTKHKHTPVLASLYWLPVCFRADFKILLFALKCLYGLSPQYLSDLLQPYAPSRSLRSQISHCLVPKSMRRK